jgi:hypothetical protein
MSLYQFVLKETAKGKCHHNDPSPHGHCDRRKTGTDKGRAIGVYRVGDVAENNIGGSWYYTWVVNAPDIYRVTAFIRECVLYGFVELYSGPTPAFDEEDLNKIEKLSAELRQAFPDEPRPR